MDAQQEHEEEKEFHSYVQQGFGKSLLLPVQDLLVSSGRTAFYGHNCLCAVIRQFSECPIIHFRLQAASMPLCVLSAGHFPHQVPLDRTSF